MNNNRKGNKMLSLLLTLVMVMGLFAGIGTTAFAKETNIIDTVEISGIIMPADGMTPDYGAILPEGAHYHLATPQEAGNYGIGDALPLINGMYWLTEPNGVTLASDDTFVAGNKYWVQMVMVPESGYQFADTVTCKINNSTALVRIDSIESYGGCINFVSVPFTAVDNSATGITLSKEYWTDLAGLREFDMLNSDTPVGKIKFGANNRTWAICGDDAGDLALLSTTTFSQGSFGQTSEYSKSYIVTSQQNNTCYFLGSSFLSTGEVGKIRPITVTTNEPTGTGNRYVAVDNMKLYRPNSTDQTSNSASEIFVGRNNNIPISLRNKMKSRCGFEQIPFWLRSPHDSLTSEALTGRPDNSVSFAPSVSTCGHIFAMNLNTESVRFGSAVDAATSSYTGYKANSEMTANTFTLRYKSTGSESALINGDGTEVSVKNAQGKYLVAQGENGAYIKQITTNDEIITAAEMNAASSGQLMNFIDCKVWIESTEDRITTAQLAKSSVSPTWTLTTRIQGGNGNIVPEGSKKIVDGRTETITFLPDKGYGIDKVTVNGVETAVTSNSLDVTMDEDKTVVVKYKPIQVSVLYRTGIQGSTSWQNWRRDGALSGTTGKGLRLEGLQVKLPNDLPYEGGIRYNAQIQNIGWQGWKADGATAGFNPKKTGGLRLESIKIELSGEVAKHYDVWYHMHTQRFGWMGWAKNGEPAGTVGYSFRVEAIEVVILPKGSPAPTSYSKVYTAESNMLSYVRANSYDNKKWQGSKGEGDVSGTRGKKKTSITMGLSQSGIPDEYKGNSGITYRVCQDGKWSAWVANDKVAGKATGGAIQGLQVKLTGKMAETYDVYYRVEVKNGTKAYWMNLAKNGASAGYKGKNLEQIQVAIVPKGEPAPTTENAKQRFVLKSFPCNHSTAAVGL